MEFILIASEFPPNASGIGAVVNNLRNQIIKSGHLAVVWSTSGSDYCIGSWPFIKRFGGLGLLWFWFLASQEIRKRDIKDSEIIWLHDPLCWVPKRIGSRTVCTIHTTYLGYHRLSVLLHYNILLKIYYYIMFSAQRMFLLLLYKNGVRYTCLTEQIKEELRLMGIDSGVTVIPNGVDSDYFRPGDKVQVRRTAGVNPETNVFLFVGRLTGQKRPLLMVDLFQEVKKRLADSVLIIVGDGELFHQVEKRAKEVCDILMVGNKKGNELKAYYQMADFFFIMSLYEGEPLVALEALSCNIPIICAPIPSLVRLSMESLSGLIVDPMETEQAAVKIEEFVGAYRNRKASSIARDFIITNRDWGVVVKKYIEMLR